MKNPLPLILTLAIGGLLMSRGSRRQNPTKDNDEIPLSMDYNDPELHSLLRSDEDTEEEEDDGNSGD